MSIYQHDFLSERRMRQSRILDREIIFKLIKPELKKVLTQTFLK